MLSYFELRKGVKFILDGEPYEVLEFQQIKTAQRRPTAKTKIRNLINGNVLEKTFQQSDVFEEAELSKMTADFLYSQPVRKSPVSNEANRIQYFFSEENNPKNRFSLDNLQIGEQAKFLKPKQKVEVLIFKNEIINISLPIKIELKVIESPPGIRMGRAEAGAKQVILETGAKINVPLFVEEGDVIEINTQTEEYVRRTKGE